MAQQAGTRGWFVMPFDADAREIVDHWRACVRALELVGDDTVEGQHLQVEIERLRRGYHALANEAAAAHRAALPPFPATSGTESLN